MSKRISEKSQIIQSVHRFSLSRMFFLQLLRAASVLLRVAVWGGFMATYAVAAQPSGALSPSQLRGVWCLVEMQGNGIRVTERIEVHLMPNGHYRWTDGAFVTDGRWSLTHTELVLSSVGYLPATLRGAESLQLEPPKAVWNLRRGKCSPEGISQQDVVALHNAAGRGDQATAQVLLGRGVTADMQDFVSGDSALILAAKFCKPSMVRYLLDQGASKGLRNLEGLTALDYAAGRGTQRACPAVREMLG